MISWLPLVLTATSGCSLLGLELPWDRDDPTDTSTPPTDTGPTLARFDEIGRCDIVPPSTATLVGRELELDAGFDGSDFGTTVSGYRVYDRSDDWRDFVVGHGGTYVGGSVDFSTEAVVFAWVSASSTCGLGVIGWEGTVTSDGTDVHVEVESFDDSRNCLEVCDMQAADWIAIVVPLGAAIPTVCHRVGGGC